MTKTRSWWLALLLLAAPMASHAAITCSISSAGFSAGYTPASPTIDITQTFFTVTCTRGLTSDPTTLNYSATANNGLNGTGGGQNRAVGPGGTRINYDLYRDAACSSQWRSTTAITGTITFSGTGTVSQTQNYWGCIPTGQGVAAGTYTDNVTMTLTYGTSTALGSAGVSIITPASCSLTTAPGSVVFTYLALGGAVVASTTYKMTCTLNVPYSMALDATSGTVLGLNYTLALGTSATTGTGVAQTFAINGSMAGAQAGTCATATCTASQARTITITY